MAEAPALPSPIVPSTSSALSALPDMALPRQVADAYVEDRIALDPVTGSFLGVRASASRLPDFSPAGHEAMAALLRAALDRLAASCRLAGAARQAERRCARLLRERLTAELAVIEAGEELCTVSNTHSPVHAIRDVFSVMPTDSTEDWFAIAARLRAVPAAVEGYRESLALGLRRGLRGGPRPTTVFAGQLDDWTAGEGWFGRFVAGGPETQRAELDAAARDATRALAGLRDWMRHRYVPAVSDGSDAVGRERYALWSRFFNGADLDLDEAYAFGWSEFHRLLAQMRAEAERVLPRAGSPWEAIRHLDAHGTHVEGADETRAWLQDLMDEAVGALDGTYFELAGPVRRVEARIAPEGGAAAPYYYPPSEDFSRPGTTWLPTMGRTRFPGP